MTGFVSFVGSGPGDPQLLTLKAVDRLKKADAVLFDDLSSGPILQFARKGADLVGVGKRANRPSPKQDAVSQLLVEYARNGGHIVRLKSGDPGIFGRLEEEIIELKKAGIAYEIIPGISSAFAAAAEVGIPLTRRLSARRIQFITGRDITGELPDDFNLKALSDPSAITIVFMGKQTFAKMQKLLEENGLPRDTPALLAEAVATPSQKLIKTTIRKIAKSLKNDTSQHPALICYGPLSYMDFPDDN